MPRLAPRKMPPANGLIHAATDNDHTMPPAMENGRPAMENGEETQPEALDAYLRDFSSVLSWQMKAFNTCLNMHPTLPQTFKNRAEMAVTNVMFATDTFRHELLTAARGAEWWEGAELEEHDVNSPTFIVGHSKRHQARGPRAGARNGCPPPRGFASDSGIDSPPFTSERSHTEFEEDGPDSSFIAPPIPNEFEFKETAAIRVEDYGLSYTSAPKRRPSIAVSENSTVILNKKRISISETSMASMTETLPSISEASQHNDDDDDANESSQVSPSSLTVHQCDSLVVEDGGRSWAATHGQARSVDLDDDEDDDDSDGVFVQGVLNPNFPGRLAWDMNTMCLVMLDVMILPFQMAYTSGSTDKSNDFDVFWLWITTSFFACDIVLNFNTAYAAGKRDVDMDAGRLVTPRMRIARNYVRTWLSIDFVSTVPWGVLSNTLLGGGNDSAGQLGKLTKVIKFVRFMRLMRMLRLAKLAAIWERIEAKCGSAVLLQGVALLRVLFVLVCICHWNACIWWMVGQPESLFTELLSDEAQLSWKGKAHWTTVIRQDGPGLPTWTWQEKSTFEAYMFCFYWTLGVMRTMPAEVSPITQVERVYIMVFMFFAFSAFAICVAQITKTFFKISERKSLYNDDMANLRMYLRKLNVSEQLQTKIKVFIRHLYETRSINAREQTMINYLPDHHKKELEHIKAVHSLEQLPLFEHVSFRSLQKVTEITERREMVPGDVLCWKGSAAKWAWVLVVGRIRVKHERVLDSTDSLMDEDEYRDKKIIAVDLETLQSPEEWYSQITVVCTTACTCLKIEKSKFLERTWGNQSFWTSGRDNGQKTRKNLQQMRFSRGSSSILIGARMSCDQAQSFENNGNDANQQAVNAAVVTG